VRRNSFTAPAFWIHPFGSPLTLEVVQPCRCRNSRNGSRRYFWARVSSWSLLPVSKLVNWGAQPLELQIGVWLFRTLGPLAARWVHGRVVYATNPEFFSRNAFFAGTRSRSKEPIGSFEGHLSYSVKPRLWFSLDGNYWFGGATSLNGLENPLIADGNSRIGGTASIPKHQSLKFSYSNGAHNRYGGNYQKVCVAWQYSWLGRPK
jgi:hypothetical protein